MCIAFWHKCLRGLLNVFVNYFLEYEYYKYRFKGGTPEEVESLMFPLFYLCGLDEIIEKHWNSLDFQEEKYKKLSG